MISGLDHVVVLVHDLEAAVSAYQTMLGVAPGWRGQGEGSQTVLFTLANSSLELLAPAGEGADADRIRGVLAQRGEGLASLCFQVEGIARFHRRLERLALRPEPIAAVESHDSRTGATLAWQRTRAATDATHGVRLFFIEPASERPRSPAIGAAPITGLDHVVISTADCERAAALYGARLGLDMALDRSHPDWGRLMFFRCGDLVIEVVHRPVAGPEQAADNLWGLSWRTGDIEATRSRLLRAGVVVSDIRAGRKPGTRVLTVRSGCVGIPTLLVEPAPKLS